MLSHDYKYRQAASQKSCSTTGQKQGSANQTVKITVESAVIMKPGHRTIHRPQQQKIPKSAILEKHPPQGFSCHSPPLLWGQKGPFQKLQKSSMHSRSRTVPEASRQALQSLGKATQQELPDLNLKRN